MEHRLHNINDLYDYLQFDKGIHEHWKRAPFKERDHWVNYVESDKEGWDINNKHVSTHSLLLYRKGNHQAFSQLFDNYFTGSSTRSYTPEGNLNWFIPYKDPVDKLLGGFLSSEYYAQKHHTKFKGVRRNFYKELEPILLQFVEAVLEGNIGTSHMYDNHLTPLSIILEQALIDKPKFLLGRLVGLNLDTRAGIWGNVYRPIVQKQNNITDEISRLFVARRSPYGEQQKHYLLRFKVDHAVKIRELAYGPLYNEYRLLDFFEHHQNYKESFYNG